MAASSGDPQRRQVTDFYRQMSAIESRIWWGPVLRGLIAIVLGVAIFVLNIGDDAEAVRLACVMIGAFALANGVISLLTAFLDRSGMERGLPVAIATISLVLGLLLVIWPVAMAAIGIVLVGLFLLATGALHITAGARLRGADPARRFNGVLVFGIVLAVLGLITVLSPIFVARVFIFFAALLLIVIGVTFIAIGFTIRKAVRATA